MLLVERKLLKLSLAKNQNLMRIQQVSVINQLLFGDLDTREVSIDIMTMLFRSIQGIWSARASGVEMPYE